MKGNMEWPTLPPALWLGQNLGMTDLPCLTFWRNCFLWICGKAYFTSEFSNSPDSGARLKLRHDGFDMPHFSEKLPSMEIAVLS